MTADRTFGFECEVAAGASDVLSLLYGRGHASHEYFHDYHCRCDGCYHRRDTGLFTGQSDCTADGELITKVLTYGTDEADTAINALGDALREARATTSMEQGVHVHVNVEDFDQGDWLRLARLWFAYQDDLGNLAKGAYNRVRSYNPPLDLDLYLPWTADGQERVSPRTFWSSTDPADAMGGASSFSFNGWLRTTAYGTVEFRLWNATRATWRLHLAIGTSVAMVQAAKDGVNITNPDARPPLAEVVMPYMTDAAQAALFRAYAFDPQENQS